MNTEPQPCESQQEGRSLTQEEHQLPGLVHGHVPALTASGVSEVRTASASTHSRRIGEQQPSQRRRQDRNGFDLGYLEGQIWSNRFKAHSAAESCPAAAATTINIIVVPILVVIIVIFVGIIGGARCSYAQAGLEGAVAAAAQGLAQVLHQRSV